MNHFIKTSLLLTSLSIGLVPVSINTVMANQPKKPLLMAQTQQLEGKSWTLVRWGSPDNLKSPVGDKDITAQFSQGKVSGSGGCNSYNGTYTIDGSQINFGPTASTKMACLDDTMNQESQYFAALDGAKSYKLNNQGQLEIEYQTDQDSGIMIFATDAVRALW